MDEVHVVTCVLRHRGRVLLLRRSDDVGSYTRRWGMVSGHAEGHPDEQAWTEIAEETGLADACTLVRAGDPFDVTDDERGTRWVVHPYLFDCERNEIASNYETTDWAWVDPTEILERDTVPDLWTTYRSVGPTLETVRADREHGSAYLSVRALEALRDEAADVRVSETNASQSEHSSDAGADWNALRELARDLRSVRDMVVVTNRVNRLLARSSTPDELVDAAQEEIDAVLDADDDAAAAAADRIGGETVLTLSRSGTVLRALETGDPDSVLVAESRPEGEGIGVAEELADEVDVTLTTDAAAPGVVADADRVLVGADAIHPDDALVNKTGTYPLALAAARAGVPVDAVCARDKIAAEPVEPEEESDHALVYDGDAPIRVRAPLFERVPSDLVTNVVTESGVLDADDVRELAAEYRRLADWE